MKYKIRKSTSYKKGLKRAIKRNLDISLLNTVVNMLADGVALPPEYRDHGLHGDYEGFRECHILPDWLLVYTYVEDVLILVLEDTGTHSDLFK